MEAVRRIFHKVRRGTPFCSTVPRCLKVICVALGMIALVVLAKYIFLPGLLTVLIIAGCLIISLCAFVMAEVFEKAIAIKDENDLTI